jgi:hypothetical protein
MGLLGLASGSDGGMERTSRRPCNIERRGKVVIRLPEPTLGLECKVLAWGNPLGSLLPRSKALIK